MNSIAQVAAIAALRNMSCLVPRVKENREQLHFVREELQKLGFTVPPSQTNFLLAMPPPGCGAIVDKLLDRGIIVRGMKPFGYGGESFRVTIGTPEENRKFIDALKEIM